MQDDIMLSLILTRSLPSVTYVWHSGFVSRARYNGCFSNLSFFFLKDFIFYFV